MQSANPLWEARNCHLQGREGQKQPRHGAKARLDAGDASCTSQHDFFYSCTGEGASNIQAVDSYMRAVLRCSTEVLAEKADTIFTRLQQQFGSGNPCPECQTVPAPSFGGSGSGGRGINMSDCDYGGDMDASVMPSVPAADHNYLHTSPGRRSRAQQLSCHRPGDKTTAFLPPDRLHFYRPHCHHPVQQPHSTPRVLLSPLQDLTSIQKG